MPNKSAHHLALSAAIPLSSWVVRTQRIDETSIRHILVVRRGDNGDRVTKSVWSGGTPLRKSYAQVIPRTTRWALWQESRPASPDPARGKTHYSKPEWLWTTEQAS